MDENRRVQEVRTNVDLLVVLLLGLAGVASTLLPSVSATPLPTLIAPVFVLFGPGYALVAALFPERAQEYEGTDDPRGTVDDYERLVAAVGASIVLTGLAGLLLSYATVPLTAISVSVTLATITVVLGLIAYGRRQMYPTNQRAGLPAIAGFVEAFRGSPLSQKLLNVFVVAVLLVSTGLVVHVVEAPNDGEQFTELYLLEQNASGEPVAANYPTEYVSNGSYSMIVGLENREFERMHYTVLLVAQQIAGSGSQMHVTEQIVLRRFDVTLAHGESWQREHTVTLPGRGDRLRLAYLVYRGAPPESPTLENAYREVHVWLKNETDSHKSSTQLRRARS